MNCCDKKSEKKKKGGFLAGIVYGLIPHIGCIAFILFTVLGVTAATAIFKPLLLNPYFFHILIIISVVFATISALFYFKKQGILTFGKGAKGLEMSFSASGVKKKWKYLLTLYGTTVGVNLLLFMVIFPIAANLSSGSSFTASIFGAFGRGDLQVSESASLMTIEVDIPCPGHAPLIIEELKEIDGMEAVKFEFPNVFEVGYDPVKTSKDQILSLDVFDTYKATVIDEREGQITEFVDDIEEPQPLNNSGSCCASGSSAGGCGCGCGR